MFDNKADKPLDFKSLKENVVEAAEPVVEAVKNYQPYKGKGKYKADLEDLPHTLADFFRATADAIEERKPEDDEEAPNLDLGQTLEDAKLKKKASDLAGKSGKFLGEQADTVRGKLEEAKLDKKAADAVKNLRDSVKDAKLDKKAGDLAKSLGDSVKDAKLDKKAGDLAGNAGTTLAGLATPVIAAVADLAGKATDTVKEAKLDKKAGDLAGSLGDRVKEAKFDKKAADVVSNAGDLASNVGDTVSSFLKDAKLDKKAADVVGTAGEVAANVSDAVASYLKEAKLDKKAADVADTLSAKVKEAKLDKKLGDVTTNLSGKASDVTDLLSTRVKEAKLDKKLADAKLPEKAFAAANLIPGVEVKNPKKAAKQFRKRRKEILKAVEVQQKDLNKTLKQRQKDAKKYIEARQHDIQTGKIRIPGYEPPKPQKGFPWGKTLLGTGLVYGGVAANNIRVWSNVPPLQSKLPGEAHYYRSRQGVVFYKEAGQEQDGKAPVVLVHGIGAGNNSYEWEPNFEAISQQYHTYAFDLLGFGNSERPNLRYTAETFIKQLTEFLDNVVGRPAMIVASTLCSSYAVQVAFRRPQLVQKLVLMEPTGIFYSGSDNGPNLTGPLSGVAYNVLRAPVVGKAIYSGIASRPGIKNFMENQMFYDKSLATPDKIDQYWVAAHQDGAEYAPPSFFTGLLNAEIGETLGKIEQPVMIIWGKESRVTPPQQRQELSGKNSKARVETLANTRLSVNQEQAATFNRMVLDFLGQSVEGAPKTEGTVGFVQGQSQSETTQAGSAKASKPSQTENKSKQASAEPVANLESGQTPVSQQLPPTTQEQPDYGAVAWKHNDRSEKGATPATQETGAGAMEAAKAPEGKGVEYDNQNLKHELEEHRKTFIGDNETGSALVQDSDNDGVDDRRM